MAKTVVIIQGHPDPAGGHLCHALADAYAEGAIKAGHGVTRIDIAQMDFPFLQDQGEFESGIVPPSLAAAHDALLAAQHIVLIFPLWLGTMPAIVKAFLEQMIRPGIAFAYQASGFPKKLLAGRSARIVVTMAMPAFAYRWFYLSHGIRGLKRNIFKFVGIKPVRETFLGAVQSASATRRQHWLDQMKALGRDLR